MFTIKTIESTDSYESVIDGVDLTQVSHVAFVIKTRTSICLFFQFETVYDASLDRYVNVASGEEVDGTNLSVQI